MVNNVDGEQMLGASRDISSLLAHPTGTAGLVILQPWHTELGVAAILHHL